MKCVALGTSSYLLLSCLVHSATAGISSFTSLASYQAASPPQLLLLDFSDNVGSTDGRGFHSYVDFDSPEATNSDLVLNSAGILRDVGSTVAPNNVGPIGGSFASPVKGIAFELTSVEGTAQTVRLFDTNGILIGEATTPVGNTFFGVVSTTPFASFVIQNGMFASGVGNDRYFLDNFRANAVPEPSTTALLLLALTVLSRNSSIGSQYIR